MCKKFKFDRANKWYMHHPAPVQENDTQTPMGLIQTDCLISTRRSDLMIINKKTKKKTKKKNERKSVKLSTLLSQLTTE